MKILYVTLEGLMTQFSKKPEEKTNKTSHQNHIVMEMAH
jgi:hypothetical protein